MSLSFGCHPGQWLACPTLPSNSRPGPAEEEEKEEEEEEEEEGAWPGAPSRCPP